MLINEKLLNVQIKLNAPKNQHNSFGNYNYRSCEDIIEAVKPILAEQKLSLTISDSIEYIGNRYYVKATARITDCEDGTDISVCAYAREEESKKGMDSAQITGSAGSYARKYALNGLFTIDDSKDPDSDEYEKLSDAKDRSGKKQDNVKAQNDSNGDPEMKKLLKDLEDQLIRTGYGKKSIIKTYKVESLHDMSKLQVKDAIKRLKGCRDKDGDSRAPEEE